MQLVDNANQAVAATVSLDASGTAVTLTPAAALAAGTTYVIFAQNGIEDFAGNHLNGGGTFQGSFTTAASGP